MQFTFTPTELPGVILIEPGVFADDRGFFMETYRQSEFAAAGIDAQFVQDNHSVSAAVTLRGIHCQLPPHAQGKLVRVSAGAVFDVAVDLRRSSPTFGRWAGLELSAENHRMLYIPPGFGHAFLALEDDTHFQYKCTAQYSREAEAGVRWDDPDVAITWPVPAGEQLLVSDKDRALPLLRDARVFE